MIIFILENQQQYPFYAKNLERNFHNFHPKEVDSEDRKACNDFIQMMIWVETL